MQRIRKNDFVQIMSGKDKGRSGKVLKVFPSEGTCIVEGCCVVKRHQKASATGRPSGIVERNAEIHLAKVMLVDSKTKKPSRIKIEASEGKKKRVFIKSKEEVQSLTA